MMTFKGGICQILDLTSDPDLHKKCLDDVLCQEKLITDQCKLDQAERWLTWARGKRDLKIVSADIPHGILPRGCSAILHDVKVASRGPDDIVFDRNKDIRDKVARGNCFLELAGGTTPGTRCIIYALKKFTGGLGDDDDKERGDNFTWKRYFLKPLEFSQSVVCTRKANGEAAHLSARRIDGVKYICAGSKNVHMLIRNRGDIGLYTEDRYRIAREVCDTICDLFDDIGIEKQEILLEFLCRSELTGIFEILNPTHQHVENFSHMKRAELRFITWTLCDLDPQPDMQLCSMPPHSAIEIARALSLPTVEYDVIDIADVDTRMKEIRRGYGYEGEVLYFVDENNSVIGLLKKKTIWYIICRAIREKLRNSVNMNIKNPDTFSLQSSLKKVEKRIREIQIWLGLDDNGTEVWKNLGTECLQWVMDKQDKGELGAADIADMFPVTWQRYLDETGKTDHIEMAWQEPTGSDD